MSLISIASKLTGCPLIFSICLANRSLISKLMLLSSDIQLKKCWIQLFTRTKPESKSLKKVLYHKYEILSLRWLVTSQLCNVDGPYKVCNVFATCYLKTVVPLILKQSVFNIISNPLCSRMSQLKTGSFSEVQTFICSKWPGRKYRALCADCHKMLNQP